MKPKQKKEFLEDAYIQSWLAKDYSIRGKSKYVVEKKNG